MRVLYVKFNSDRAKEFQIKTIIYEENERKYVKKIALCNEAVPHLKKMKTSYNVISNLIVNSKLKLAKILSETYNSLTFEYIDGVSFKKEYSKIMETGRGDGDLFIEEYIRLIKSSFNTRELEDQEYSKEFKNIFGDVSGQISNDVLCFSPGMNVDLIMSNLIRKDEYIYIIDYEWLFDFEIPVDYVIFRVLNELKVECDKYQEYFTDDILEMEESFVFSYVNHNAFFQYSMSYTKDRNSIQSLKNKTLRIANHPVTGPIIKILRLIKRDKTFGQVD